MQYTQQREFVNGKLTSGEQEYRTPPHNLEAEQALLGAILLSNDCADKVNGFLKADDFYDPVHQEIFDVALKTIAAGRIANPVTLGPFFEAAPPIAEGLTVRQYLGRLAINAVTTINAYEYGRVVADFSVRRHLAVLASDMANAAYNSPVDFSPKAQIEEAEARLYSMMSPSGAIGRSELFQEAVTQAVEHANKAYQAGGGICGLRTYLTDLDRKLGGLQPGDLIVVAGRPAMGKTALAINNFAFKNAQAFHETKGEAGAVTGIFSMEMGSAQLAMRILAEHAEVTSEKMRRGMVNEDEFKKIVGVAHRYGGVPLIIDQSGGLTLAQLTARARRMKRQHNIGLLVIDYIQLMQGSKRNNRVEDVSEITNGLKALAKELQVPVVALSQLSRNVEHRTDKRPQLADLRESGSIEQDADVVLFVYREEYYVEREKPSEDDMEKYSDWMARMTSCTGKAEVIISKQRHGPTGRVDVMFDGPFTRFSNLASQTHAGVGYAA